MTVGPLRMTGWWVEDDGSGAEDDVWGVADDGGAVGLRFA